MGRLLLVNQLRDAVERTAKDRDLSATIAAIQLLNDEIDDAVEKAGFEDGRGLIFSEEERRVARLLAQAAYALAESSSKKARVWTHIFIFERHFRIRMSRRRRTSRCR